MKAQSASDCTLRLFREFLQKSEISVTGSFGPVAVDLNLMECHFRGLHKVFDAREDIGRQLRHLVIADVGQEGTVGDEHHGNHFDVLRRELVLVKRLYGPNRDCCAILQIHIEEAEKQALALELGKIRRLSLPHIIMRFPIIEIDTMATLTPA